MSQQNNSHSRHETPDKTIEEKRARLRHAQIMAQAFDSEFGKEIVRTLQTVAARKRRDITSVNPESPTDLATFEKRALFDAGYVQGIEYVLNDLQVSIKEIPMLEATIAELEGTKPKRAKK